ncbi:MAG: glycogen/starch synthase, partial [Candidatus Omnitrophota bacterium]
GVINLSVPDLRKDIPSQADEFIQTILAESGVSSAVKMTVDEIKGHLVRIRGKLERLGLEKADVRECISIVEAALLSGKYWIAEEPVKIPVLVDSSGRPLRTLNEEDLDQEHSFGAELDYVVANLCGFCFGNVDVYVFTPEREEIIFTRRAFEPNPFTLTVIAGSVDNDDWVLQSRQEITEEIGLCELAQEELFFVKHSLIKLPKKTLKIKIYFYTLNAQEYQEVLKRQLLFKQLKVIRRREEFIRFVRARWEQDHSSYENWGIYPVAVKRLLQPIIKDGVPGLMFQEPFIDATEPDFVPYHPEATAIDIYNQTFLRILREYAQLSSSALAIPNVSIINKKPVIVPEGHDVTLQVMANRPDLGVILHSNISGGWQDYDEPFTCAGVSVGGEYLYEITFPVRRNFMFTCYTQGFDGRRIWAPLPRGNGLVLALRDFIKVAFSGMEFRPIVMGGGAGDVMYELPKNLAKFDKTKFRLIVVIPYFKLLKENYNNFEIEDVDWFQTEIPFVGRPAERLRAKVIQIDNITVYMLDAKSSDLFVMPYAGHLNDRDRRRQVEFYDSILLSRGKIELLARLGGNIDVCHFNDHHTALGPLYMISLYHEHFSRTGWVFTVHNDGYKGIYPGWWFYELGLPESDRGIVTERDAINMLGIIPKLIKRDGPGKYSNTVSLGNAHDVRERRFDPVNRAFAVIGERFGGILNGIDNEAVDPKTHVALAHRYSIDDGIDSVLAARRKNRRELEELLKARTTNEIAEIEEDEAARPHQMWGGLKPGSERLLFVAVQRFVGQKQLDIIADVWAGMLELENTEVKADLLIVGPADEMPDLKQRFIDIATHRKKEKIGMNVAFINGFIKGLFFKILASCDAFYNPSDYAPAEIAPMLVQRFGCVPLVRWVGGLRDFVFEGGDLWNGFHFVGRD